MRKVMVDSLRNPTINLSLEVYRFDRGRWLPIHRGRVFAGGQVKHLTFEERNLSLHVLVGLLHRSFLGSSPLLEGLKKRFNLPQLPIDSLHKVALHLQEELLKCGQMPFRSSPLKPRSQPAQQQLGISDSDCPRVLVGVRLASPLDLKRTSLGGVGTESEHRENDSR